MQVSHLTEYGLPKIVVDSWRRRLGEELLPIQKRAVLDKECRVLDGANLLIAAPTSSGKTFCGELAAVATVFKRKKALFVVPLKSIAEERYDEFVSKYSGLGIRVVIATGDRKEFDGDLERGAFDLAILIYEKLNQLLVKNIDLLASVDLLVIDEIQLIGDVERGGCLELALLKALHSGYRPQIIALSAVLRNAGDLAEWLDCRLLADDFRPVELRQGVLSDGCLRYRSFNSGREGTEQLSELAADDAEGLLLANIEHLVKRGEQVLVFLRARRGCEELAAALAERNFWSPAEATIDKLGRQVGCLLGKRLSETLRSAVAFHHADLSYRQRRILEEGFRSGEIKVMVATTTLAMGVNLPAQSVFIDCYKYQTGRHSRKAMVTPLSWGEYEAMSGRAGRYDGNGAPTASGGAPRFQGSGEAASECLSRQGGENSQRFGRSILVATSKAEAETLWNTYINGSAEKLESRLDAKSVYDVILDLIASRVASRWGEVYPLLQKSLYVRQGGVLNEAVATEVLTRLEQLKLVFEKEGRLEASPIGRLISVRGISVATGMMLISFCRRYSLSERLSWLYFILSLPDANLVSLYIDRRKEGGGHYHRRLRDHIAWTGKVSDDLRKMATEEYIVSDEQNIRLKGAFLLLDWTSELATAEIELRYGVNVGSILQVAETAAWLLDSAAEVAGLLNRPAECVTQLRELAAAVGSGFDLPGSVFHDAGFAPEQRDLVWGLSGSGIMAAKHFCEQNRAKIARIVGEAMAGRLIEKFGRTDMNDKQPGEEVAEMSQLRLRGLMQGDRVHFSFRNTEIDVTPKSFNYLYKLSAARLLSREGWLNKEEIEPGFNQAKNIYRVKQELRRFATGLEDRIENNKSGFYRINLLPQQIKIDFDSMKSFSDLELAELTKRLEGCAVS